MHWNLKKPIQCIWPLPISESKSNPSINIQAFGLWLILGSVLTLTHEGWYLHMGISDDFNHLKAVLEQELKAFNEACLLKIGALAFCHSFVHGYYAQDFLCVILHKRIWTILGCVARTVHASIPWKIEANNGSITSKILHVHIIIHLKKSEKRIQICKNPSKKTQWPQCPFVNTHFLLCFVARSQYIKMLVMCFAKTCLKQQCSLL